MATAVGDDYFDGTSPLSRVRRHLAIARRTQVKYLRCAFSWNAIEKQPGHFDWRFWDALVNLAEQNGIQLVPYVAYTPEWAARDAKDFWKQPPRDPKLYGDFMYTIAARYRGRIHSWEIWNEPDNKDFWTGTADEFSALAELAARRIREADPNAVLVLGGMAYGPGKFFQHLIASYHIDRYVDVIAMHAYPETWLNERAETVFQHWLPQMAEMIRQDDSGDDLWINEMGYADYRLKPNQASVYGTSIFYGYEHTRTYQAEMLFKFETLALASDEVDLTGWYRIDDFALTEKRLGNDLVNYHLGLVDRRGQPKPALYALRFFNRLLNKSIRILRPATIVPQDTQSVINAFSQRNGTIIVAAWLRSSREDEITQKSGTLIDKRAESVSMRLPCVAPRAIGYFDVTGAPLSTTARITGNMLQGLRLKGSGVVIVKIACREPANGAAQ